MVDTAILDKLRKVLALCTSPVEGEAQLAAERLQQLLTKYNLEVADLEVHAPAMKPAVTESQFDLGKAAFRWKLDLAETVATHYFCAPIVRYWNKEQPVTFVGRPDNVESLKLLYGWLIDQVRAIASEERRKYVSDTGRHIDPLRWQLNFGEGCVRRLGTRLEDLRRRMTEDVKVDALVVHHLAEASDYTEERYGRRFDGRKTKWQEESDERWERRKREREELLKNDPDEYYRRYPHEHPDAVKAAEEAEAKRQARRKGRAVREETPDEYRKRHEGYAAYASGQAAGDRVNLQPFLNGNDPSRITITD